MVRASWDQPISTHYSETKKAIPKWNRMLR
jgi:hypothetical protein